jgi:hypothetical protein
MMMILTFSVTAKSERFMAFGISPISAILGGIDTVYQIKVNNLVALTFTAGASLDWIKLIGQKITRIPLGFFSGIGTKLLLNRRGLKNSFFLEPHVDVHYYQLGFLEGQKLYDTKTWWISPIVKVGYDWYFDSNFFMSLGANFGANLYIHKNDRKLPKSSDFLNKRFQFPPRGRMASLTGGVELMLGVSW